MDTDNRATAGLPFGSGATLRGLLRSSHYFQIAPMRPTLQHSFSQWRGQANRNWVFFRQWLRAPLRTASIVPSSARLGRAMAMALPAGVERVVELGAGTGAITRALLRYRVSRDKLLVVELNPDLHQALTQALEGVRVVCADARHLGQVLEQSPGFHGHQVDAIVSSLGLLSMPPALVEEIVTESFRCLAPHGHFVQFTYGPRCPVNPALLKKLHLRAERVDFTLLNVPPASVYVLTRAAAHEGT